MLFDYGYAEEGHLGKPYNIQLFKRLIPFLQSYRRVLLTSIVLVVGITLLDLAIPYFNKVAIDRYIVPKAGAAGEQRLRQLTVDIRNPEVNAIVKRNSEMFQIQDDKAIIAYENLNLLDQTELAQLRQKEMSGLGLVVLLFLSVVIADFVLTFIQKMIMEYAGHRVMHDLRITLYDHIQEQSLAFFTHQPVARLVTRVTNDVSNMHELFTSFIALVFKDVFLLIGIAIALLILDWRLALTGFAVLPAVAWAALRFSSRARDVFRALRVKVAEINTYMAESIDGIKVIQCFGRQAHNFNRFARLNAENLRLGMRQIHVFAVFMPVIEALGIIAMAIVLFYGGLHVLSDRISLGTLVAILTYIRMFFRPMRDLAENYNVLQNAMASAERIFDLLDTDQRLPKPAIKSTKVNQDRIQQLKLDNVSFAYLPDEWVLNEVSFVLGKGQTLALVGPTGAGKTSILNLILRLYDPISGSIHINGLDLRSWHDTALKRLMALVPQDPVLFTGSLEQNIFGNSQGMDVETVQRILTAAHCRELVAQQPQGLNTLLTKGGASLSSGQRQLIAIARALARDPQLILLDEATSHIDSQTEAKIHHALHNLMTGRTGVIVAHRLSTARMADRIIVMHQGRAVESGSHIELMAIKGFYWRLNQQYRQHLPLGQGVNS